MDTRGPGPVDVKKYRVLKRKYKALEEETYTLTEELTQSKKRIARLQKERSFLLDRLLKYERVSSDSDSSPSPLSSEEEREERPRKLVKKEGPGPGRPPTKPRAPPKENDNIQLCIGRGKDDRPCKSKALPGFKHCWHHAPLDPNSPFVFCQYIDHTKRYPRKCSIPVAKDKSLPFCNYHVKRVAPQAETEGIKLDTVSENGEQEPEPEPEGEDVEVEGDDGDINLSGDEVSISGEDRSPNGEPLAV